MTMQQPVSPGAMRRINGFVAIVWFVGLVCAAIAIAAVIGGIGATAAGDASPVVVDDSRAPIETPVWVDVRSVDRAETSRALEVSP
jgi:hypothetical protein